MEVSPIVSPSGDPVFSIGGEASWKTGTLGEWNASLEWARRGRQHIRILVLWPISQSYTTKPGAWTIASDAMLEFLEFDRDDKATGRPTDFCMEQAKEALPMMGRDRNDKQALFGLVDAVMRFGPDLATMPATPIAVQRALAGEAMWQMETIDKASGKTLKEAEV